MNILDFRSTIRGVTGLATGLSLNQISWETRPQSFTGKCIVFTPLTLVQITPDRIVRFQGDQGFIDEISTLVDVTISFRCEDLMGDAFELVETLRSGFMLPSIRAVVSGAGITVLGFPGPAVPVLGYKIDSREVSAYTRDIQFRFELHRADPVQTGFIEHVRGTGKLDNAGEEIEMDLSVDRP